MGDPERIPAEVCAFEERLAYRFHDRRLLLRALTHSSWRNEDAVCRRDNQRLEFLGDAVLSLVVSEAIFRRLPDVPEGELTRKRARIVRGSALAAASRRLDLGRALRLGRGETRSGGAGKDSILADAFEAVLGAVYLDGGYTAAAAVVRRLFAEQLEAGEGLRDPKSRLQEAVQTGGRGAPEYELLRREGPEHEATFVVAVSVDGERVAEGQGRSKKDAEMAAAAVALEIVGAPLTETGEDP